MVTVGVLAHFHFKPGSESAAEQFFQNGRIVVDQQPVTTVWFAFRLGPTTYGAFAAFASDEDREALLSSGGPKLAASNGGSQADRQSSDPSGIILAGAGMGLMEGQANTDAVNRASRTLSGSTLPMPPALSSSRAGRVWHARPTGRNGQDELSEDSGRDPRCQRRRELECADAIHHPDDDELAPAVRGQVHGHGPPLPDHRRC